MRLDSKAPLYHLLEMSNHSLLQRAFDLTGCPEIKSISDIRSRLMQEGYSISQVSQLGGPSLTKQLTKLIHAANRGFSGREEAAPGLANGRSRTSASKEHQTIWARIDKGPK